MIMADSGALRARRRRAHLRGDHRLCRPDRCPGAPGVPSITPVSRPIEAPSSPVEPPAPLVEAYRARLKACGRADTPEGQHVIRLAEALSRMADSAAGLASLSRELRLAMEAALAGAPRQGDALDELAGRRRRRFEWES